MHRERPWAMGWGKPNLVRNVKEKMLEAILIDGMRRQVEIQELKLRPTQDNQTQWQSKNNSKMMLENECSCMFFEMFSWRWHIFLSNYCSNGGMETWTTWRKKSRAHLKWTWNGSEPKLITPIAPNKNGQLFYKNLNAMVGVISFNSPSMC
jgi:hypothetical protein